MLQKTTLLAGMTALALTLTIGCGKKVPKEAKTTMAKALDALKAKDKAAFKKQVSPDQREDLRFDKPVVIGDKSHKNWSLDQILSIEYFSTIKDYKIGKSDMWSKNLAHFIVTLRFDDGSSTAASFYVKKTKDGWKLDMKKMIEHEKESNGANAFSAMKLKKK